MRISTPPVREASDEAQRGDGLAGAGGVLEPEPAGGARVLRRGVGGGLLLGLLGLVPVERLVVVGSSSSPSISTSPEGSSSTAVAAAVAVAVAAAACDLGGQRDQRARQRVDLVRGEHGAVGQLGLLVGRAGARGPSISEYSRRQSTDGSSRPASSSASAASSARRRAVPVRERGRGVLSFEHERLPRELFGARRSSPDTGGDQPGKCFQP